MAERGEELVEAGYLAACPAVIALPVGGVATLGPWPRSEAPRCPSEHVIGAGGAMPDFEFVARELGSVAMAVTRGMV